MTTITDQHTDANQTTNPVRQGKSSRSRNPLLALLQPFASLKLTIGLLFASLILILAGTLAQVDQGLWIVLETYFRSTYVLIPFDLFFPQKVDIPGVFPWPGGATIGALLFVNLIAAHTVRFKMKAKGAQRLWGSLWTLAGFAAIGIAFFFPPVTHFLAKNIVVLFALGTLFFVPLLIGTYILFGKRIGIVLIHASLIALLAGEFVTALSAVEEQMPIYEGQATNWAHDIREVELALIDTTDPTAEKVWAISQKRLEKAARSGQPIQEAGMPLAIEVEQWIQNADIRMAGPMMAQQGMGPQVAATHGIAKSQNLSVRPLANASGVVAGQDAPAAIVRVLNTKAQTQQAGDLGQYLVSILLQERSDDQRPTFAFTRQAIEADQANPYAIVMRYKRAYKPYTVELKEFRHDLYPGTNRPKNFSSDIVLTETDSGHIRPAHIKMNDPLRHAGETFFQASWLPNDSGTVLQVVTNPGWTIPYIACIVGGLGLAIHFMLSLLNYLTKQRKQAQQKPAATTQPIYGVLGWTPAIGLGLLFTVILLGGISSQPSPQSTGGYDLQAFGSLLVVEGGRDKPLDSIARDTLLVTSGKSKADNNIIQAHQAWPQEGNQTKPKPALLWMLDTWAQPQLAGDDLAFRIDHRDIKHLIDIHDTDRKRFTINEINPKIEKLQPPYQQAQQTEARNRSAFQRGLMDLASHLGLFFAMAEMETIAIPPIPNASNTPNANQAKQADTTQIADEILFANWRTLGDVITDENAIATDPYAAGYRDALHAYNAQDPQAFNQAVQGLIDLQNQYFPKHAADARLEQFLNRTNPKNYAMVMYFAGCLCVLAGWIGFTKPMHRAALVLLLMGFVVHTLAIGARIHLMGRPPVTNLYSSAVFTGWAVVGLGLILELISRHGLGYLVSTIAGIATLLIARGLEKDGDTMAVLQAVLDTNFWLATHVIIIILGYAATFVAALFGAIYIFAGLFTKLLANKSNERRLHGLIYGTVCFGLLLSFVGTILGGIWADQSWGRFWGWDPKENGAMLIVIWGAIILHARWGGMVKKRGFAVLSLLGAIVTIWSWFGTNLLGAGLHSYGFMDGGVFWCTAAGLAVVAIASLASVPMREWASFRPNVATQDSSQSAVNDASKSNTSSSTSA